MSSSAWNDGASSWTSRVPYQDYSKLYDVQQLYAESGVDYGSPAPPVNICSETSDDISLIEARRAAFAAQVALEANAFNVGAHTGSERYRVLDTDVASNAWVLVAPDTAACVRRMPPAQHIERYLMSCLVHARKTRDVTWQSLDDMKTELKMRGWNYYGSSPDKYAFSAHDTDLEQVDVVDTYVMVVLATVANSFQLDTFFFVTYPHGRVPSAFVDVTEAEPPPP